MPARAQSVAQPGEILVTRAVYDSAASDLAGSRSKRHTLKGFEAPVELYTA
jgi:class 3 adenylate cyclase